MILGVDTGGTFTDFVLWQNGEVTIHKVLSTPSAPERAILQGITDLNLNEAVASGKISIVHGSTVATNAALENKGVRTAFITNRGFRDLLSIGRQTRSSLYDLQPQEPQPPVPKELCLELDCRVDAQGNVITQPSASDIKNLLSQLEVLQPQAVAICFLFSYLNDSHERLLETELKNKYFVTRSSFVLPEYKEYERGMATWLNAYLGPTINRYLQNLRKATAPAPLSIMQSSGGTIDANQASRRAVNLLLSGPAGGLAAAKFISDLTEIKGLMTFDMGGTSTDVALTEDQLQLTNEGQLGPYPVAVPMVDMHTIGAGGGSIAYIDDGGLLQVGPLSAGADPGPACYGQGGQQPTVTDANVVLGRIPHDSLLAGSLSLDVDAAHKAIARLAETISLPVTDLALGILQLANEHMVRALRLISVQKGHDPQQFHLCCFGGAGGLHVCDLAESLNMSNIIVPRFSGVLSALGMIVAPRERQLSLTVQQLLADIYPESLLQKLDELFETGRQELITEGAEQNKIQYQPSLDLRYRGQSYTININLAKRNLTDLNQVAESFQQRHQVLYGHRLDRPVELVTLRQRVFCNAQAIKLPQLKSQREKAEKRIETPCVELHGIGIVKRVWRDTFSDGQCLQGPLLITEAVATTLVKPGWEIEVKAAGNLLLKRILP